MSLSAASVDPDSTATVASQQQRGIQQLASHLTPAAWGRLSVFRSIMNSSAGETPRELHYVEWWWHAKASHPSSRTPGTDDRTLPQSIRR